MAISLQLQQLTKQPDGTYAARVNAVDNATGNVIQKTTVTGTTKTDFKDELRPKIQKMIDSMTTETPAKQVATDALSELETEFNLPSVVVP